MPRIYEGSKVEIHNNEWYELELNYNTMLIGMANNMVDMYVYNEKIAQIYHNGNEIDIKTIKPDVFTHKLKKIGKLVGNRNGAWGEETIYKQVYAECEVIKESEDEYIIKCGEEEEDIYIWYNTKTKKCGASFKGENDTRYR